MEKQFKKLFRNPAYLSIFNWRGIEKAINLQQGKIKAVAHGDDDFTDDETGKLYNLFAQLAKDSIDAPNFTA